MKRLRVWRLLYALAVLSYVIQGQDICDEFVADNSFTIDAELLEDVNALGASMQDLVDCLSDGGSIALDVRNYEPDQTLEIRRNIDIISNAQEGTSITCNGGSIFNISEAEVEISNLRIRNCELDSAAPVVVGSQSTVTFTSVTFQDNVNRRGSAAIAARPAANVIIQDSSFFGNAGQTASAVRAGRNCNVTITSSDFEFQFGRNSTLVLTNAQSLTISDSIFRNNTAQLQAGAAINIQSDEVSTDVQFLQETVFENNLARRAPGGAVSIRGSVSLFVEDTRFTGNWAWMTGGAIYFRGSSDITIQDSFFIENASNFTGGGAIYAENVDGELDMLITNSLFSGNDALTYMGSGGAIRLNGRSIRCNLTDSVLALNTAELDGGGLYIANGARVRVEGTSFVANEAFRGGGPAIFVVSIQQVGAEQMLMDINNSTFFFNRALGSERGGGCVGATGFGLEINITNTWFSENDGGRGSGGAVYVYNGPDVDLENVTFTRNRAVFGGALYGENDARYFIINCNFTENVADEGGAILTQGDVDVFLRLCILTHNSALTEGGAIKVLNYRSGGTELARIDIANTTFISNSAGSNLFEDALYGTQTGGGALLATGNGVDLTLMQNFFEYNEAAEGGAVNVRGVGDCYIADENIFFNNTANSGGAIFVLVDERIFTQRFPFYMISRAEFDANKAGSGGGIFVGDNKAIVDGQSINARRFMVRVENSTFHNNCVLRGGGGLSMFGSGVIIHHCSFTRNAVNEAEGYAGTATGGALRVAQGAGLEIKFSNFTSNSALMGGAACITDASVLGANLIFRRNSVSTNGIGGAVAIDLSPGRDIPVINSPRTLRNLVFQCDVCLFIRNDGANRGGALHLHDVNSAVGTAYMPNCTTEQAVEANFGNGGLTCTISYNEYLLRLQRRSVRFRNTHFERNTARVGGAIFTNNAALINVTTDLELLQQHLLDDNTTYREVDAGVTFEENSNFDHGYGPDTATTPVVAQLQDISELNTELQTNLTYTGFASGDRLRFRISFLDDADQTVTVGMNVTATILFCMECSEGSELEISGQDTEVMNNHGEIDFTATRLRGRPETPYVLRIEYSSSEDLMTMPIEPSYIHVTMRPCMIGESTNEDQAANVIECVTCIPGTFTANPNVTQCFSCADVGHGRCSGNAIIPDEGYWHANSFSFNMKRCIGQDSCKFDDREDTIAHIATEAHEQGLRLLYMEDRSQCASGYTGPLCGSCENGYGREGQRCRKCAAAATRYILMFLFIFWTFAFLSYFIRSVLQLASRIEFNRKFNTAPTDHQRRFIESIHARPKLPEDSTKTRQHPGHGASVSEISEGSSSQELRPSALNIQSAPSKKDLARIVANRINVDRLKALRPTSTPETTETQCKETATPKRGRLAGKLAALATLSSGEEVEPLTLCNPVAEILKIAVNFLQVTAVAASINVDWTDSLRRALIAFGSIGAFSSGSGFLSLDCFMIDRDNPKSVRRMIIMILYPLMIFFVYVIFWSIYTFSKKRDWSYFNQRVWLTYLAINYFIYIGMTKNLLRFFACAEVSDDVTDDEEKSVWEEDSSVECFSRRHALTVGILVVPLLCAVTIGFPLGTFIILKNYQNRLNEENIVATYGFLYRAYDQHYWEVVIMLRKAVIATIAVFAYGLGENLQGLMCILVMVFALGLHLAYQPFTKEIPQLNLLETCSLCTTVFVFVVGLMMNDDQTGDQARVFLSFAAIFMVTVTFGMMLLGLLSASEEVLDMKLIEEEVMEISKILDTRLSKKLEILVMHYWSRGVKIVQRIINHLEEKMYKRARSRQAQATIRRRAPSHNAV